MTRTLRSIAAVAWPQLQALFIPAATAMDTVELTVLATVTPTACTPIPVNGGVIDFGTIPASSLSVSPMTTLQPRDMALTVNCDAPTSFAVRFIDNRKPSMVSSGQPDQEFGLGSSRGKGIGHYLISPSRFLADSKIADEVRSRDGGASWDGAVGLALVEGSLYSFAPSGTLSPGTYQNATIDL